MRLTHSHFHIPKYFHYSNPIKGLQGCGAGYRFSFNGKEKDNETYGEGNEYDYGFRIFNPRLGRFLSIDPLTNIYPELTPFQYASNTPIWAIDIDGLEAYPISRDWNADDLANFGNFITEETARIRKAEDNGNVNSYTVYDCSDLVISIYVRYAMANGLPITLTRYKDFSKYSSSDKEGIDQWDPADPEGSKLRFETYVREMTNTATLRIDMVSISADQAGPGDAQVTKTHAMLIRPTLDIDNPTQSNLRHHYVDASQNSLDGPGGLGGTFIRTPFDGPTFQTNLFRFREIANVAKPKNQINEIQSRPLGPIPVDIKPLELKQIKSPYIPKR
jgi:RHS repeat-associated protein